MGNEHGDIFCEWGCESPMRMGMRIAARNVEQMKTANAFM